MKIFMVGGAVRDKLLGIEPKDVDYVIVGATQEDVAQLIKDGFQPVGASFPVFLHPVTGDEYALARVERKTGAGYHNFAITCDPTVTLEQDLMRRDLTINAMAYDPETDTIIDPYGGVEDLKQGTLRHTSEAFAEDPVRVLRTARFAARYGFVVDADTITLMMQVAHELSHVSMDRIWKEIAKGIQEPYFERMLDLLRLTCPGVDVMQMFINPRVTSYEDPDNRDSMAVRMAIATSVTQKDVKRYQLPKEVGDAVQALGEVDEFIAYATYSPTTRVHYLTARGAFNNVDRLQVIHDVASAVHRNRAQQSEMVEHAWSAMQADITKIRDTVTHEVATMISVTHAGKGAAIRDAIAAARAAAINQ